VGAIAGTCGKSEYVDFWIIHIFISRKLGSKKMSIYIYTFFNSLVGTPTNLSIENRAIERVRT
jgi:hypothetical protein